MSPESSELASALDRAAAAYRAARHLVFDHYPPGQVPPSHALTREQREALDELAAAENDLRTIRWVSRLSDTQVQ